MRKELDGTYYFYNEEVNGETQTNMIFKDKETGKLTLFTNIYPVMCHEDGKPFEDISPSITINFFPVG